jgi:diguanylate cyclase (GGDEF)-like protein/PAS domain S-box-containing protein
MAENIKLSHVAFLVGPTGKITSWNEPCQRILGYPESAVLLRSITHLLAPETRARCIEQLRSARRNADVLITEILHQDGTSTPVTLTFIPQFRRFGKFSGYSIIMSPIEEGLITPETEQDILSRLPLKSMVNFLAGTFYVINEAGQFVVWNKRVEIATQLSNAELAAVHVVDLFPPEDQGLIAEKVREVFEHDGEVLVEASLLSKNRMATPYLFTGARCRVNQRFYLVGMGLDITQRRKQEEQLRLRERALHASSNGIVMTRCVGSKNPIEYVNPAFERITGYRMYEVLGRDMRFLAAPGLDDFERSQLRTAINERRECNVVFRNLRKCGAIFWNDLTVTPVQNEQSVITHFIGVINDVTESKHRTSHLEYEINHDALTGLANRNLLWDRLEQALSASQRNKALVALLLLDLDNFKGINDSLGHDAGDEVLKVVARRLQSSVRDSDTVARLSGDEFVLILYNQPSLRYTMRMIDRLREELAKPMLITNKEISIGSSMGVSIYPHDGASVRELIKAADVAMYHAKAGGRNEVNFFSSEMKSRADAKNNLEKSMRNAIERNEFFLLFQPKMGVQTEKIIGAEALLRWKHPEQGILLPAAFLLEAEESGLIVPFGEWVIHQLCAVLQRFHLLGFQDLSISMNVSFREFSQKNYVSTMAKILNEARLAPDLFGIEIKEAHLMRNPELAHEIMAHISELGVKLTIDEFGIGPSSLSDLPRLPVANLKIQRSFVEEISDTKKEGILAKTMISIGHNMNINVIAVGVETRDQLNFLKKFDCDQMQGNYLSEPISIEAFEHLVEQQRPDAAKATYPLR